MLAAVRTKKFIPKPAQPEIDPRFKGVKDKIGQKSQQLKKHPPAKQKASEAAKAAKGPPNEKAAGAKAKQVDSMKDAKAEAPPPDSFLVTLRAEIEKVMPSNIEEAGNFMDGGAESEMKGAVGGNVKQQKETASGDLQATSNQPPNEGGVAAKPVESVPPDAAAPVPSVNGGAAMPAAAPEADVTQKQTKADAQTALKENKLEGKRLENKDSRFAQVKSEKGNVDKTADASPGKFRASEKQILGKSAMQAATQTRGGMTAVVAVKNKSKTAVQSRQDAQRQKDELRRKAVTDRIEGIYTETKNKVDRNLNRLEADVMGIFDPGSSGAIAAFKANTNRDIDKFYDERYSGVGGKLDWIADKFKDTPPRVKEIIQTNLKIFTKSMDNLAVRIAAMVDRRLNQAKADIDGGQAKIKTFVASLPRDLKAVGQEAEKAMDSRFGEMREGVEAKKNDLAQKLAQKYKEAHDQANELAKKIEEENAGAFQKLAKAIGEVIKIILEFKDKLMALLRKAADAIDLILDDPIGFLGNLISAIKQGVGQFVGNIWTHIKAGFMKWLFGSLADTGIEIPADLSLVSIFKLVMGVLGLTVPRLKAKAVKLLGPTAVAVIEKLIEYVSALITGGPAKLWEEVKSDIGDLKAMVIDAIQNWVIDTIIKQATIKLLSFFNPAGAFVQAVLAIYNLVMFLIENASKIMAFVEAVIESVSSIAKGAIGAAANWIEQALARMIPLVIGFLARLIGLGGISKKVKEFIEKVQGKVDKAIDKVLAKIVQTVKKLFGKMTGKGKKDDKRTDAEKEADLKKAVTEAKALNIKERKPKAIKKALIKIQKKYNLTELTATPKENIASIYAAVNPEITFELDSPDASELAKKVKVLALPGINALSGSAPPSDVEKILNNALKQTKVRNARLEFRGGDPKTGIHAEVFLIISESEPEKIGAIWNIKLLYVKVGNPVGGPASVFKNQKTGELLVADSAGQFVPSTIVRDINEQDRKALNRKQGIAAANPSAKRFPVLKHVAGKDKGSSPFISAGKEKEDTFIRAALTDEQREKGETKGTPFYRSEHGRVRINLFHINSKNIFDLSTRVGQDHWEITAIKGPVGDVARADVVRTKEVLIKGEIPFKAIEEIAGPTKG